MGNNEKKRDEKPVLKRKVNITNLVEEEQDINNRINQLYGISEEPEAPKRVYDAEELKATRKKMLILLIFVICSGVILFIIMLNPFSSSKKEKPNKTEEKQNEEEKNKEKENDVLEDGNLELNHELVTNLKSRVALRLMDFYYIDPFNLYSGDQILASNIPDDIKLYLITREEEFKKLLTAKGASNYDNTCDGITTVLITKPEFDELLIKYYGPDINFKYSNFHYTYVLDNGTSIIFEFTYVDNIGYSATCKNSYTPEKKTIEKYLQQKLVKAEVKNGDIYLYDNVVFIREDGVYKDNNFSELITNNIETTFDDYINAGSLYRYIFKKGETGNYYLYSIEKTIDNTGENNS